MNKAELRMALADSIQEENTHRANLKAALKSGIRKDVLRDMIDTAAEFTGEAIKRFPSGVAGMVDVLGGGAEGLVRGVTGISTFEQITGTKAKEVIPDIKQRYDLAVPTDESTYAGWLGGNIGEELGATVIPSGAALKFAKYAEKAPRFIRGILQAAKDTPGTFATGETIAAGGAGTLRTAAQQEYPDSPWAESAAQIAGSFMTIPFDIAMSASRLYQRAKISPADVASYGLKKHLGEERAPQLAADIRRAAERFPEAESGPFTPGMLTNDQGLLGLEKAIISKHSNLTGRYKEARMRINELADAELKATMGGEQSPTVMVEFLQGRADKLIKQVDESVALAGRVAEEKLIKPSMTKEAASRAFRGEADSAEAAAKVTQRNMWRMVDDAQFDIDTPITVKVGGDEIKTTLAEHIAKRLKGRGLAEELPSVSGDVKALYADLEFLNKRLSGGITVRELQELRSELLEKMRTERGADRPNKKLIAAHNELQGMILDAMMSTKSAGPLKAALSFSKKMNDTFYRGALGDVLGYTGRGDLKITPAQTLASLSINREAGGDTADDILRAMGDNDTALYAVKQYIYNEFRERVAPDGIVRPGDAARFVKSHEALLNRFPGIRQELSNAGSAQALVDRTKRLADKQRNRLMRQRAAMFLEHNGKTVPPEKALSRVVESGRPQRDLKQLLRSVDQDTTGMARVGLRSAFHENFVMRGTTAAKLRTNFNKMKKSGLLTWDGTSPPPIYTIDDLKRIDTIITAKEMAERVAISGTKIGSDTVEKASMLLNFEKLIAGYAGAYAASYINPSGGGAIRTSSNMIRLFETLFQKEINPRTVSQAEMLIDDAAFNPAIMETLLMRPTRENLPIIQRRLRGHLFNLGVLHEDENRPARPNSP